MKYLILGSNGMAGHVLALHLLEQGHSVRTVARSRDYFRETIVGDVKNFRWLDGVIAGVDADVIINAVGMLVSASEENRAEAALVNGYLPHHLARTLHASPARLIHLSTDCVFSGLRGPYQDDAPYDGQRFYDRSKALGEVHNSKDLTIRMSIIGPELKPDGVGLFNWFMRQRGEIQGYTHSLWNGVTTIELAKGIEALADSGETGLTHLVPDESVSKHDLLTLLNEQFDRGLTITPHEGSLSDKRLVASAHRAYRPVGYAQQLDELSQWLHEHPHHYPHYSHKR